jgi:ATP-dependent Clp protease ATP-binding subunit ClpA
MMHERFTDRAREAMQLACQEALRLNCQYVGTDHALFGIVEEGGGIACNVLRNLDVDLRAVRRELEKVVPLRENMVLSSEFAQTPRLKQALKYAGEACRVSGLGTGHVGTDHLLLGLLREGQGVAAQVLRGLGVGYNAARREAIGIRRVSGEVVKPVAQMPLPSDGAAAEREACYAVADAVLQRLKKAGKLAEACVAKEIALAIAARRAPEKIVGPDPGFKGMP